MFSFLEFYFYNIHGLVKRFLTIGIVITLIYIGSTWTHNYYLTGENLFSLANFAHDVECANRLQRKYNHFPCTQKCPTHEQEPLPTPITKEGECHCHFPFQHYHLEHFRKIKYYNNIPFYLFINDLLVFYKTTRYYQNPDVRIEIFLILFQLTFHLLFYQNILVLNFRTTYRFSTP